MVFSNIKYHIKPYIKLEMEFSNIKYHIKSYIKLEISKASKNSPHLFTASANLPCNYSSFRWASLPLRFLWAAVDSWPFTFTCLSPCMRLVLLLLFPASNFGLVFGLIFVFWGYIATFFRTCAKRFICSWDGRSSQRHARWSTDLRKSLR